MSETVDISLLPQHIQDAIKEAQKPPAPLFPIAPREHTSASFQTKEQNELAAKIDLLIRAVNELWAAPPPPLQTPQRAPDLNPLPPTNQRK